MSGELLLGVVIGFVTFAVLQGLAVGLLFAWGTLLDKGGGPCERRGADR